MSLMIRPFSLEMPCVNDENQDFCESIFSQGNGYMGIRGFDPLGKKKDEHTRSVYLAGCFEYIKPGITDMVNTPDLFSARLEANAREIKASLFLDMKTGLWERRATWLVHETPVQITTKRIVSMQQKHLAAMRIEITAPEEMEISLLTGIDPQVANLPISDNQMTKNSEEHRLLQVLDATNDAHGGSVSFLTGPSHHLLHEAYQVVAHHGTFGGNEQTYTRFTGRGSMTIEQFAAVYSWHDGEQNTMEAALKLSKAQAVNGFEQIQNENAKAWARLWEACDIRLDAPEDMQGALRYNIFQLLQNNASDDPYVSIGARGLMHGRYKGNYFWDTELFMLPFYQYTRPEAAKNLLMYRWHTLQDAITGAKNMGLAGARYPWMCSDTGFEQCETWDTGCCEIHITADVALAVLRYAQATGDEAFLMHEGAEILLQTARYWESRLTWCEADDCWHLLFVKGPDEYCGVTSDNTYTNYLVARNLMGAYSIGKKLLKQAPEKLARWGFDEKEILKWRDISEKIPLLYDEKRDLYLEDALFEKLEPLNISSHKQGDAALYRTMSFDRLQRYQVCKQADLVLLMTLFPDEFTQSQKQNVYAYYEPKTLHDSTLSFGVHALLAARLGRMADAGRYFEKSVFLDLKDVMQNTAGEGIHMAALGASWQTVIFGFAGLDLSKSDITLKPALPNGIDGIHTTLMIGGKKYAIDVTRESSRIIPL